jgi:hypothetical protein
MEETASLLVKGENAVLNSIEKRLGTLEFKMEEILERGDQFNEATQEKLELIQEQLEKQSSNMRRLRRSLLTRYSPFTVFGIVAFLFVIWFIFMYNVVYKE